jgi:adenylylsulfate kinase
LAASIRERLGARNSSAVVLDGDVLRDVLGAMGRSGASYERSARLELALTYGRLCRVLAEQGLLVVISTISLFQEVHAWNRENLPNYFEVYLRVPATELTRRNSKGLYTTGNESLVSNVVGVDIKYDEPEAPDWIIEYGSGASVESLADEVLARAKVARANMNVWKAGGPTCE